MDVNPSLEFINQDLINVYSEWSGVTLSLIESFLKDLHRVNVYSENVKKWKDKSIHLKGNKKFSIEQYGNIKKSKYNIYFSILSSEISEFDVEKLIEREKKNIEEILSNLANNQNLLVISPYSQPIYFERFFSDICNSFFKDKRNIDVIFFDNLLGKRMLLGKRDSLSKLILGLLEGRSISVSKNEKYFPIDIEDFVKKIKHRLMDGNRIAQRTLYLGVPVSIEEIIAQLRRNNLLYDSVSGGTEFKESPPRIYTEDVKFLEIDNKNILQGLVETIRYFKEYGHEKESPKTPKLKEKIKYIEPPEQKPIEEKRPEIILNTNTGKTNPTSIRGETTLYSRSKTKKKFEVKFNMPKPNIDFKKINLKMRPITVIFRKHGNIKNKIKHGKEESITKNRFRLYVKKLIFVILILLMPYLFTFVEAVFLLIGTKTIVNSQVEKSKNYIVLSRKIGDTLSVFYNNILPIPILGSIYETAAVTTSITQASSDLMEEGVEILETSKQMFAAVLNDGEYDIRTASQDMSLRLDLVFRKMSFMQSEYQEFPSFIRTIFDKYYDQRGFNKIKSEISAFVKILEKTPQILGVEGESTYLVLFQNNMELRPTGGFIGSFGILSFQKGKLINLEVYDVYSADGQLKGYVKPPDPIAKYLNQPAWYLRDSNWDADFTQAALKAQWFLEKEMNIKVDGVVSVDLEFVKGILDTLGPVYLEDYDKEINSENLYQITQYEVEKEFFPGSRRKSNFLSSLVRELLFKIKSESNINYAGLARNLYGSLQGKNVQVYFNDEIIADEFYLLGWDGSLKYSRCMEANCYSDLVGIVEANVGVNKSNFYVDRKGSLNAVIENRTIKRDLDLVFTNNANPGIGSRGVYKNYFRVLIPVDSKKIEAKMIDLDGEKEIKVDVEYFESTAEVGIYFEIGPGQSKRINLKWVSSAGLDFGTNGKYILNVRKQSGVNKFDFDIDVNVPKNVYFGTSPKTMLTQAGGVRYNTMLTKDESISIYW